MVTKNIVRKTKPRHLVRVNVPLRLQAWVRDSLDLMPAELTRTEIIESAIIKTYRLKPPKDES